MVRLLYVLSLLLAFSLGIYLASREASPDPIAAEANVRATLARLQLAYVERSADQVRLDFQGRRWEQISLLARTNTMAGKEVQEAQRDFLLSYLKVRGDNHLIAEQIAELDVAQATLTALREGKAVRTPWWQLYLRLHSRGKR